MDPKLFSDIMVSGIKYNAQLFNFSVFKSIFNFLLFLF